MSAASAAPPVSNPLVSVVVPVYNGERFLAAALESVFAQDYRPFEVIVVDDGSTDATAAIAQTFDGARSVHQPNQGPAAARNAGISLAQGELIAFHDADDVMAPNKLSAQIRYLRDHPEVGCALARQEVFCEPGVVPPPWLEPPVREILGRGDRMYGWSDDLRAVRLGGLSSVIVRTDVLARCGGFDPTYRHAEDVEWLFRLHEAGVGIGFAPDAVVHRRIHGANATFDRSAVQAAWLRLMKDRIDRRKPAAAGPGLVSHGA